MIYRGKFKGGGVGFIALVVDLEDKNARQAYS